MGDNVARLIEAMVPELEDLQSRNIFSTDEIRQIVQRRRNFEWRLQRRVPLSQDFLQYIEFELNLDRLRGKRKEELGLYKNTQSDFSIQKHVHFIFERLLRKYSDRLDFWNLYFDYCRLSDSHTRLGKMFPRALQLLPTEPSLWIQSALWEFGSQNNVDGARVLFQRALRFIPANPDVWIQFYAMELQYIGKIRERRRILGLETSKDDDGGGQGVDTDADKTQRTGQGKEEGGEGHDGEEEDERPHEEDEEEEEDEEDEENGEEGESKRAKKKRKTATKSQGSMSQKEAELKMLQGALPRAIFVNAIAVPELKDSLTFRLRFLHLLPTPKSQRSADNHLSREPQPKQASAQAEKEAGKAVRPNQSGDKKAAKAVRPNKFGASGSDPMVGYRHEDKKRTKELLEAAGGEKDSQWLFEGLARDVLTSLAKDFKAEPLAVHAQARWASIFAGCKHLQKAVGSSGKKTDKDKERDKDKEKERKKMEMEKKEEGEEGEEGGEGEEREEGEEGYSEAQLVASKRKGHIAARKVFEQAINQNPSSALYEQFFLWLQASSTDKEVWLSEATRICAHAQAQNCLSADLFLYLLRTLLQGGQQEIANRLARGAVGLAGGTCLQVEGTGKSETAKETAAEPTDNALFANNPEVWCAVLRVCASATLKQWKKSPKPKGAQNKLKAAKQLWHELSVPYRTALQRLSTEQGMHIVRAWVELQLLHSPSRQRWAWCVEVFANAVKAVEAAPRTGARLSVIKSLQLRQVEWLEAHRAPGAFPSAPSVTALESALAAIPSRGTPSLEVYLAVFQAMRRLGGSVNSDQQAKRQEVSSSPTPIPLSAALVMQEASRVYGETEPELWLHWLKASPSAARATLHTRALKTLRPPYHSAYTTGAMHIWSGPS